MTTSHTARRLALALPGVVEGSHQQHADFRVRGRIFATLWTSGLHMVLLTTPLLARQWIREEPRLFKVNGWTAQGAVTVELTYMPATRLATLLRQAWELKALAPPRSSRARPISTRRASMGRSRKKAPRP